MVTCAAACNENKKTNNKIYLLPVTFLDFLIKYFYLLSKKAFLINTATNIYTHPVNLKEKIKK